MMQKRILEYGLILLLLIGSTAGLISVHAEAANQDLELLLPLSEQIMASDKLVIVKHTGSYRSFNNKESFTRMAREISSQLNLPNDGKFSEGSKEQQDPMVYQVSIEDSNNIAVTLICIGFPNGSSELVVSVEADRLQNASSILKVQKQLTEKLTALGLKPNWNIMIQGMEAPVATSAMQEEMGSLHLPMLSQKLQAQEVGRYEDKGSLSISYYSPQISGNAIAPEKEKMNLQVAVHRNSISQQQRITIGSPAISIEY
jgi:hypothetical protein